MPCSRRAAACRFAGLDVYLNVAGGLRIGEPAADLAVAGALLSAREDVALPRPKPWFSAKSASQVPCARSGQTENRLKEAGKLGFSTAVTAAENGQTRPGIDGRAAGTWPRPGHFRGRDVRRRLKRRRSRFMNGFTLFDAIVAVLVIIVLSRQSWPIRAVSCARADEHRRLDRRRHRWLHLRTASVEPLMRELPVVGRYLADSLRAEHHCGFRRGLCRRAGGDVDLYAAVFLADPAQSAIGGLDRGLGFLFGAARRRPVGCGRPDRIYDRVVVGESLAMDRRQPHGADLCQYAGSDFDEQLPDDAPWLDRSVVMNNWLASAPADRQHLARRECYLPGDSAGESP